MKIPDIHDDVTTFLKSPSWFLSFSSKPPCPSALLNHFLSYFIDLTLSHSLSNLPLFLFQFHFFVISDIIFDLSAFHNGDFGSQREAGSQPRRHSCTTRRQTNAGDFPTERAVGVQRLPCMSSHALLRLSSVIADQQTINNRESFRSALRVYTSFRQSPSSEPLHPVLP